MIHVIHTAFAMHMLAIVATTNAIAQGFANGSLTGPRAEGQLPPSWAQYHNNTSDTANATGPFGTYNLSPNGGTFVRSFSWQRDTDPALFNQREGLEQLVSGLEVGQLYDVSFYQSSANGVNSISGEPFSGAAGYWTLTINGTVAATSSLISPPAGTSLNNVWSLQNLLFTAGASSQLLSFLATVPDSEPVGTRTFMLIDGISIHAIPEPSTAVLTAISLITFCPRCTRNTRIRPRC